MMRRNTFSQGGQLPGLPARQKSVNAGFAMIIAAFQPAANLYKLSQNVHMESRNGIFLNPFFWFFRHISFSIFPDPFHRISVFFFRSIRNQQRVLQMRCVKRTSYLFRFVVLLIKTVFLFILKEFLCITSLTAG